MSRLHQLHYLKCDFCSTPFKDTSTLNRHIRTNKKCLSNRPKMKISCVWCNEEFISKIYLEKHNCPSDKESMYLSVLEKCNTLENQIENIVEDKDRQIKDLQEKLFLIAKDSKKTTNVQNNTYNVTLQCGKPMTFSVNKMLKLLKRTCNINYMLEGEAGLGKWFIDHGCRNDKGEICLQSTDKNRGIFKYIDENDDIQRVEKDEFLSFFQKTLNKYTKTKECKEINDEVSNRWQKYHGEQLTMYLAFIRPKNKFFRYVLKETHKGKIEFINNGDDDTEDESSSDDDL